MNTETVYSAPKELHESAGFKSNRMEFKPGHYEPHVYVVRCSSTRRLYIGMRIAKGCRLNDLGNRYFTSSKYIRYSWKSFNKSITVISVIPCLSNHDAILLEDLMIAENDAVKSDKFINRCRSGVRFNNSGLPATDIAKQRMSESRKRYFKENPGVMDGENHNMYGKKHSAETLEKISIALSGERNPNFGKPLSDWRKKILSERMSGESSPWFGKKHKPETIAKMSAAQSGEKHYAYGTRLSPERRRQISEGQTGDKNHAYGKKAKRKHCKHCGKTVAVGMHARWHGDKCASNPKAKPREKVECAFCGVSCDPLNHSKWHGVNCKLNTEGV